MNHYGLIMAGGGGTRFWPLSRQKTPKQLLNLTGKDFMINEAVDRMANVIGKSNIFIITSELQAASMIEITEGRVYQRNILAEPTARNTTACIGYAAMMIRRKYGDGVMIITPADHYIQDTDRLNEAFTLALRTAEETDKLVTIGIRPSFPATEYGYIRFAGDGPVKSAVAFKEKPDQETAGEYFSSGSYFWNSGMFIWKASLILDRIRRFAPDIHDCLEEIVAVSATPSEQEVLHEVYPKIRDISIDYAVMEPAAGAGDVLVIPCECGWNDIGSWDMMEALHGKDSAGNVLIGDAVTVNTKESVIYASSRTVTAVDVDNLVIVETPDVVMVCRKDKSQNVRKIVEALKEKQRNKLI